MADPYDDSPSGQAQGAGSTQDMKESSRGRSRSRSPVRNGGGSSSYRSPGRRSPGYRRRSPPPRKPNHAPAVSLGSAFAHKNVTLKKNLDALVMSTKSLLFTISGSVPSKSKVKNMLTPGKTDRSRGFGFIVMSTVEEATRCVSELNGVELNGRRIRVDYSVTERPHAPTPGEYMGLRRSDYGRRDKGALHAALVPPVLADTSMQERDLAGSISAAYQYYKELPPINPSTLTGAIDVIVIQRKDETGNIELACTPFHVRFGKWQVLRPSDKKVNVLVNGRAIPFNMKIGEAGEAFFVFETEEDVPEDLITSPILQATNPTELSGAVQKTGRFGAKEPSIGGNDADTKELVGGMEEQTEKQAKDEPVPEPDFFDLDATSTEQSEQHDIPPLTKLPPSTYGLPSSQPSTSLPHPNDTTASASHIKVPLNNVKDLAESAARLAKEEEKERIGLLHDKLTATQNILGNDMRFPSDDSKSQPGDEALPKHKKSGSPPPVAYLHDAVIDMAG
ncbi:6614_t:CDS:2, partial [Acaulospora colombiana]